MGSWGYIQAVVELEEQLVSIAGRGLQLQSLWRILTAAVGSNPSLPVVYLRESWRWVGIGYGGDEMEAGGQMAREAGAPGAEEGGAGGGRNREGVQGTGHRGVEVACRYLFGRAHELASAAAEGPAVARFDTVYFACGSGGI